MKFNSEKSKVPFLTNAFFKDFLMIFAFLWKKKMSSFVFDIQVKILYGCAILEYFCLGSTNNRKINCENI